MKAADLEAAVTARDTVKQIDKFLEIYIGAGGNGPWRGTVTLSIGGYVCEVSPSQQLGAAIAAERATAMSILEGFGIDIE